MNERSKDPDATLLNNKILSSDSILTHLDLFTGIGGFSLAAQWAGFTTIGFSEIEPYACRILSKHWPDVPNLGDIRNVRGIRADLITGGFPCQPFSVAGKRGGAGDDRALWPEMRRVIAEITPTWVLAENVPGIINMELDSVLSDLESLGYACWPLVIPACAVDAKHRRDRVWILADASGERRQQESGGAHGNESSDERRPTLQADFFECRGQGNGTGIVANAHIAGSQGHWGFDHEWNRPGELPAGSCRWTDEAEWFAESGLGRVAHGIPNRTHRLRALGNAIVPQVAYQILRVIKEIAE